MKESVVSCPKELLEKLADCKANGYYFRGHSSKYFKLQPSAFRPKRVETLMRSFRDISNCHTWKVKQDIEEEYRLRLRLDDAYYNRVLELTKFIMMYNYNLVKYYEDEIKYSSRNDLSLDQATQDLFSKKDPSFWINKNIFLQGVRFYLHALLELKSLSSGEIIKKPDILNHETAILTVAQEMPFQHYGVSTSALDWSANPDVAIYFAMQNVSEFSNYLRIFSYKQIEREGSPVLLGFESKEIINKRRERQEGCFTYFAEPWLFYYSKGVWPSIEDYISEYKSHFDIQYYDLANTHHNRLALKKILDEKGITKKYLIDEDSMEFKFGNINIL